MRSLAVTVFAFALASFVLTGVAAQDNDANKKDVKDEKKDAKDEKKVDEKKDEAAKKPSGKAAKNNIDPEEEKILKESYPPMRARVLRIDGNSTGEITVQLARPYPPKVAQAQQWYAEQIRNKTFNYETINQYRQKLNQANEVEIRTGAGMKVRTMMPPQEFDEKGNLKRWTPKELAALRGSSRLPGYPAQIDYLRQGQIVDLYIPKLPAAKTGGKDAKKKRDLDDDFEDPMLRPEVSMIVILYEPPPRP